MLVHRGTDAYVTRPVSSLLWGTSADITYSLAAGRWHSARHPSLVATSAGIIGQVDFVSITLNNILMVIVKVKLQNWFHQTINVKLKIKRLVSTRFTVLRSRNVQCKNHNWSTFNNKHVRNRGLLTCCKLARLCECERTKQTIFPVD